MEMHPVYLALDPYLIWFYRLTDQAALNFVLGTFVLAWLAVLVGECSSYPRGPAGQAALRPHKRESRQIPGPVHGGPEGREPAGL